MVVSVACMAESLLTCNLALAFRKYLEQTNKKKPEFMREIGRIQDEELAKDHWSLKMSHPCKLHIFIFHNKNIFISLNLFWLLLCSVIMHTWCRARVHQFAIRMARRPHQCRWGLVRCGWPASAWQIGRYGPHHSVAPWLPYKWDMEWETISPPTKGRFPPPPKKNPPPSKKSFPTFYQAPTKCRPR